MGTQLIVDPPLVAFAKEVEIPFAEGGQEGVGIARLVDRSRVVSDDHVVGIDAVERLGHPLKDVGLANPFEPDGGQGLFVDRGEFDLGGVWKKRSRDQPRAVTQRVKAQHLVRRSVSDFHQTAQFILGQDHRGDNLADQG